MNTLCQRLSLLDPTFKKQQQNEQPFSAEELKIFEEVRRECEAQNQDIKNIKLLIHNVTRLQTLHVRFRFF